MNMRITREMSIGQYAISFLIAYIVFWLLINGINMATGKDFDPYFGYTIKTSEESRDVKSMGHYVGNVRNK